MRDDYPVYGLSMAHLWDRPSQIANACRKLSVELRRERVIRTPDERRQLAHECASLLWRMAEYLTNDYAAAGGPERVSFQNRSVVRGFMEWLDHEALLTRRVALSRAAEFVVRDESWNFTHGGVEGRIGQRFVLVDEGPEMLRRFLVELDAIMGERGAAMAPIGPLTIESRS